MGSRMLFSSCGGGGGMSPSQELPSSRGLPDVSDLGLGLQSLTLSGWERPWSSQESDNHTVSQVHTSSPSSKYRTHISYLDKLTTVKHEAWALDPYVPQCLSW